MIDESETDQKIIRRPHCRFCGHELTYIVKYCPICGEELY